MYDFNRQSRRGGMAGQFGANDWLAAYQDHAQAVLPRRLDRAFDFRLRGTIRTHRVERYDAWHRVENLAGLFDFQNLAALIVAAFGAGAMWHFALVTIWALGERVAAQRVVRAPGCGALLRVSPFWIGHLGFLSPVPFIEAG